jgi:hypothetical protein
MRLLTADEFRKLAASVRDAPPTAPGPEKRRAGRADCKLDGLILPVRHLAQGTTHQVTIRDMSARGVSFLHDCNWKRGEQFVIQIEGAPSAIFILCMVAHSREAGKDLYRLGAEFVCVLDRDPHAIGGRTASVAAASGD